MIIFTSENRTRIFFFLSLKITKLYHVGHMAEKGGENDEGKFRARGLVQLLDLVLSLFCR